MTEAKIVQMLVSGRDDLAWFNNEIDTLTGKYNNRFIAFSHKKVIDSDAHLDSLLQRLRRKGVDTSDVLVRFVSKIKAIL